MFEKYDIFLMDLDDTLLDFEASEKAALAAVFESQGLPFTKENEEIYIRINKSLWKQYELGEISRDRVTQTRFQFLFDQLGVKADGQEMEKLFRAGLDNGIEMIEGAAEVLTELKKAKKIYTVSNGVLSTQMKRLGGSGLIKFMDQVFISEDVGYPKPRKEFFDHVFKAIGLRLPEDQDRLSKILIVGDSLTSDIQGGINAGIDTCWFNPRGLKGDFSLKSTYEIQSLYQLLEGDE